MKFIDSQGRLFGRINVIDFTVIIFLFCLMPIFYFGYRIFQKKYIKVSTVSLREKTVEMGFNLIEVPLEIAKLISAGDREFDKTGAVRGEVVWVGKMRPYKYMFDVGCPNPIIREDPNLWEVPVRLRIRVEVRFNAIYYNDKQVVISAPFYFITDKYTVAALVAIDKGTQLRKPDFGKGAKSTKLDLNIVFKDLDEETVQLISLGDKEVSGDETIAEVVDVGKVGNNIYTIDLGGGNFITAEDSSKRQVSVRMRLKAIVTEDGEMYYKDDWITNNSIIAFKTGKYSVKGVVAKGYEPTDRWVSLRVRFAAVIPELSRIISDDDMERDVLGKVVARIRNIVDRKYSEVLVLKEDKFIMIPHPFQKDIVANMDILCTEKNGVFYFKNSPVKIGNSISFTTDMYTVQGEVIGAGE